MTNGNGHSSQYFSSFEADFRGLEISKIVIVSDLHLGEGYCGETRTWHQRENFTDDAAFVDFLKHKRSDARGEKRNTLLVLNGDFIDFVRITRTPSPAELEDLRHDLDELTAVKLPEENYRVMSEFDSFHSKWHKFVINRKWWQLGERDFRKQTQYGLLSLDFLAVYKLKMAALGHTALFQGISDWLLNGLPVAIVTGNHDVEFDHQLVQAYFRNQLEKMAAAGNGRRHRFDRLLKFYPQGLSISDTIFIEHGDRYEWHTDKSPVTQNNHKNGLLRLPPGSMYNYYLINHLEREVTYLAYVKPSSLVISYFIKRHPLKALRYVIRLLHTASKLWLKGGEPRKFTSFLLLKAFSSLLPVFLLAAVSLSIDWQAGALIEELVRGLSFFGSRLPLSICLPVALGMWLWAHFRGLAMEPRFSLDDVRKTVISEILRISNSEVMNAEVPRRFLVCGHTHQPTYKNWRDYNTIYFNCGTWTPIFEFKSGIVTTGLSKTFVEFEKSTAGWDGKLQCWKPILNVQTEPVLRREQVAVSS